MKLKVISGVSCNGDSSGSKIFLQSIDVWYKYRCDKSSKQRSFRSHPKHSNNLDFYDKAEANVWILITPTLLIRRDFLDPFFHTCPMKLHNEIQDSLHGRQKMSLSAWQLRIFGINVRETICDVYTTCQISYFMSGVLDKPPFFQQKFDLLFAFCGLNSRQQDFKSSQLIWRNICFDGLNPQGHNHIPNLRENTLLFTWKDFSFFFFD